MTRPETDRGPGNDPDDFPDNRAGLQGQRTAGSADVPKGGQDQELGRGRGPGRVFRALRRPGRDRSDVRGAGDRRVPVHGDLGSLMVAAPGNRPRPADRGRPGPPGPGRRRAAPRDGSLAVGLTIATVAAYSSWGITAQAQGFTPDELVAAAARVHAIEYAVATANGTWCEETRVAGRVYVAPPPRRWLSGFMFDRPSSTPTEPVIYDVWPGSEAEKSGLRPGDRVTHVAGRHLGYGKMAQETYARLSRGTSNLLTVVTEGHTPRTVGVGKSLACGPGVVFVDSPDWLAATNGRVIFLSAGTASSLTDDELAVVIGHELAHITLRHHEKKQNRALLGAILGAAVGAYVEAETGLYTGDDYEQLGAALGAISYSKRMERRADCRGVYYAARAGYDVNAAPFLWERLANTQRDHQTRGSSHPSHVERAFRTRLAADNVRAQLAGGSSHRDIPVPECREPKLKKAEREALLADHSRRQRRQEPDTPRWETINVKTISDIAEELARATSQPANTAAAAETELLAQLIAEFVEQKGRAPDAGELDSLKRLAAGEDK